MQLVADRFAMHDDERVVDLATGMRVVLKMTRVVAGAAQLQWTARCDLFQRLHHRAIAPLLDYGLVGRFVRFEAWQCGPAWSGAVEAAARARTNAADCLRAAGLAATDSLAVHVRQGSPVVVPDIGGGEVSDTEPETATDVPLAVRGLMTIQRSAVPALAEMFAYVPGPRPHVAAVWGAPGSGKTTLAIELARLARLNGFVPIAARFIGSTYDALWRGRSVFVVDDGENRRSCPLVHASMQSPVPHVLFVAGAEEIGRVRGLPLGRVSADDLVGAVFPRRMSEALETDARAAAEAARGLPERFLRLLWSDSVGRHRRRAPRTSSRAAEQPVAYGGDERAEPPVAQLPSVAWPTPGELAALRRKVTDALAKLTRGRHAAAIRQLRQTVGALIRRGAWADAADGAMPLAATLLRRGRPRDALKVLDDVRTFAGRSGGDARLLDAAVLAGEAWIDLARLDEAETVLAAAVTSATTNGDRLRIATSSLALARCLFWRGKYDDAAAALSRPFDDASAGVRARRELLAARIAVGRFDIRGAVAATAAVAETASSDAAVRAAVAYATAFVHLAIDDLDAVQRHAAAAIALARQAHDPLRAIRARLLLAEADRRRGRSGTALGHVRRIGRMAGTLPPLLKARVELIASIATSGEQASGAYIAGTGLPALALFLPIQAMRERSAVDPLVADALLILRACQTADDELVVLRDVCGRVRQQLHAAAVAIVAGGPRRCDPIAGDGGRVDGAVAERAMAAGITIAPHQHDGRVEAAAPIHYGGTIVGALSARWPIGSTYDLSRASTVMTMTAAAVAPILSAALAHRQRPKPPAPELIGTTTAMVELKRGVERAASAPFAVLIEGESGSGKELVAQAIHRASLRRDRPLRTLNCAALPDDLVEAELFGHVRGSFTGAVGDRTGVFEEAHGGTLFLDEIGELSPRAQAKLLRVIQEGEIRRVGENLSRRVDVRIVAATNRDLRREVEAGRFRVDLLYRLDVIRIAVPPLRERAEDVPLLVDHFWREATSRVASRATLAATTLAALARYHWPGNVRELQNVLASLAVRCGRRGVVGPSALPPHLAQGSAAAADKWRLDEARRTFDERFVRAALVRSGGHRGRAAEELGVTRQGLTKLMARLGISSSSPARDTG